MLPPLRYADGNILTTILADREVMSIKKLSPGRERELPLGMDSGLGFGEGVALLHTMLYFS